MISWCSRGKIKFREEKELTVERKLKTKAKTLRTNLVTCILDRNTSLTLYLINFHMVSFNNDYFRDSIIEVSNTERYLQGWTR